MRAGAVLLPLLLELGACVPRTPQPRERQGPDDPESCVDAEARAKQTQTEAGVQRLDGAIARLDRCTPEGALAREEMFEIYVPPSSADDAEQLPSVTTTLPDCAVADCFARELEAVRVAMPGGVSFRVIAAPGVPPRRPTESPATVVTTRCGGQHDRAPGRLSPDTIQTTIRQNYGRFRLCYEAGLARSPTLAGNVSTRFVIERDGHTTDVGIVDNQLPDCQVVECIRSAYETIEFPAPDGGIVAVVYPIMLQPG